MALHTRYRRKMPSSPEVQGLFFDKTQDNPAFFNPSPQTGDRGNSSTVVQRQEATPAKPEEEKPVQKQAKEEDKPVQKKAMEEEKPIQKQAKEEDKPVQKQTKEEDKPVQNKDKEPVRVKGTAHPPSGISEAQQEQVTGLPDTLKASIEKLSGIAMDDVKVHYNSSKPAQMKALAYTQGTDIYLAPGQEKHLPHEAWHVVQQKKGRVEPTLQTKGVGVNDNPSLEQEATVMGQKANDHSSLA
jgi:hypothetical protein